MKNKLTAISLSSLAFLTLALPTYAADLCPDNANGADFSVLCRLSFNQGNLIGSIITAIFVIAIIVALAFLIWGGLKWILSGGDKGKVDAARQTIIAAVIGLVVIFLSYFILNFVVGLFIPNFSLQNVTLPRVTQ